MTNDSPGVPRRYGPFFNEPEPAAEDHPGADHGPPASGSDETEVDRYGLPVPAADAPDRFAVPPPGFDRQDLDPAPTSGAPGRSSPDPTSGAADPHGLNPAPTSPDRYGPGTTSGASDRYGLDPHSGAPDPHGLNPAPISPDHYGLGPTSSGAPDRFGLDSAPSADLYGFNRGPRIEPSPPPQRNRLIIGLIAGLLTGLVVFGAGGFFLGRTDSSQAAPIPAPEPSAIPSLGVYEQSQLTINQAKLTGTLAPIAQGWLPYLSSCARTGDPGGPSLNKGEKARVRCRFDGMSVIFVEYATVTERDKARVKTLSQNVDARTLTPGVGPAAEKAGPSGRTNGSYVEYGYTVTENNQKLTVAGVWWDDAPTPVAAYMLAYWKDGVAESWAPMREVWARYA